MPISVRNVTEENFHELIHLSSKPADETLRNHEKDSPSKGNWINRAIYDEEEPIGYATHGFNAKNAHYELISLMIGYPHQGKGYGTKALQAVLEEMEALYSCHEIWTAVMPENQIAISLLQKANFHLVSESNEEKIYKLDL